MSHRIVGFLFIRNIASLIPSFAAHQKGTLWCHIHFPDGQETPDYNEFIVHSKLSSFIYLQLLTIYKKVRGPWYVFLTIVVVNFFV